MRHTLRVSILAAAAGALLWGAAPAIAGGGCHSGATQADARGTTSFGVAFVDACFTPSVLRVDRGTEITFTNMDPLTHNVGGLGWGNLDDMTKGDAFTASFPDEGIYPYACSYHPMMTGAIVVGDGLGVGNGGVVSVLPVGAPETVASTRSVDAASESGWVIPGAVGLLLGAAAGVGLARVRRTATGS